MAVRTLILSVAVVLALFVGDFVDAIVWGS
jgi:hypothetical protein